MNRRQYLNWLGGLAAFGLQAGSIRAAFGKESTPMKLSKTKAEWAALLPAELTKFSSRRAPNTRAAAR